MALKKYKSLLHKAMTLNIGGGTQVKVDHPIAIVDEEIATKFPTIFEEIPDEEYEIDVDGDEFIFEPEEGGILAELLADDDEEDDYEGIDDEEDPDDPEDEDPVYVDADGNEVEIEDDEIIIELDEDDDEESVTDTDATETVYVDCDEEQEPQPLEDIEGGVDIEEIVAKASTFKRKDALDEFAGTLGIKLDARKSLANMVEDLRAALEI